MLILMLSHALSMLYLYTIYAWAMGFYDKDMKKWSMNFGKMGRKRKKGFNWALFGKIGSRGLERDAEGTYFCLKFFFIRRIQVTNATFRSWFINWLKTWFGVSKLSLFLGLLFRSFSTKLIYSSVVVSKFVFLGIYWRTKPFRLSFAPLSQLW